MSTSVDKKIDELLQSMTLKEKIGQLNMTTTPRTEEAFEKLRERLQRGEVGSIILASSDTAGNDPLERVNSAMCNRIQKVAIEEGPHGIPIIYGRDIIHGHRTIYPIPLAMAAAFNDDLVKQAYRYTAVESSAEGVHWTFAPMLDLCRDPRYGRIIEGPGEDPVVGKHMARSIIEGFQDGDVAKEDSMVTCAKHFIGYGASEGGRDYYRTEISPYSLFNYYLPAFREAIEAGCDTVMSSFNDINGEGVSGSHYYMTELLRDYLGFKGCVVADWAAVAYLRWLGMTETDIECSELALNAGVDIDMCVEFYTNHLEQLVEEGRVSMETIDTAVRRVLEVKFKKNLFENPYCKMPIVDRTEHLKFAREVAAECMVLLKNDNKVLPLSRDQKIALLGPLVHERRALLGSWAASGKAEETPTFYEAMVEAVGADHLITATDPTGLYDDSVRAMYKADVVVLALGESEKVTGERHSLSEITLSTAQLELIRKAKYSGKKVIGVLFCGRPLAMEGIADLLDGVLYAWHSGSETARAACDLLFGDKVPSGKTAITFPRNSGHIPIYYNATRNRYVGYYGNNSEISYEDSIAAPYYPFGYGLSYTEFAYSNMQADCKEVSVKELKNGKKLTYSIDVSNIGDYEGKEVVQLYIHDIAGKYMRPYRELKQYQKMLFQTGETKTVTFEVGYEDLGYYLPDGTYVVEPGTIDVYIGANCQTKNYMTLKVVK